MKTVKIICLSLIAACFIVSCQKSPVSNSPAELSSDNTPLGLVLPELLCPKTVPLCAGRTSDIGTVTVATGIDGKVYITYTVTGQWRLKSLHLYAGPDSGIPVTNSGNPIPGQFPYHEDFSSPYMVTTYTFILSNMPTSFTVAAHAAVVKVLGLQIIDSQTGWGDGCSGVRINPNSGGSWGTKFTYTQGNCGIEIASTNLCSQSNTHFYSAEPLNVWADCNGVVEGDVTVGGFNYTEAEGRDIYATSNGNSMPDAKKCFIDVSTLKLSWTNYAQDPGLFTAVTTVETWLATRGKLTPANLPNASQPVKDAANYIDNWITNNICIR
jgi:hypothetical protein